VVGVGDKGEVEMGSAFEIGDKVLAASLDIPHVFKNRNWGDTRCNLFSEFPIANAERTDKVAPEFYLEPVEISLALLPIAFPFYQKGNTLAKVLIILLKGFEIRAIPP
jgi:hypothetical protein